MTDQLYKKILLPTDGSKLSDKSEEHALLIAKATGAEIIALSVVENTFFRGLPADDTIMQVQQLLKNESRKNLDKVNELKEKAGYDINISLRVAEGHPADGILEIAKEEDVDLIVMGSSGKTGLDRFIIGSVAEKVVKGAKCAVLVVH